MVQKYMDKSVTFFFTPTNTWMYCTPQWGFNNFSHPYKWSFVAKFTSKNCLSFFLKRIPPFFSPQGLLLPKNTPNRHRQLACLKSLLDWLQINGCKSHHHLRDTKKGEIRYLKKIWRNPESRVVSGSLNRW